MSEIASSQQPEALRLGDLLVRAKLISTADLEKALAVQRQIGGRLGAILVRIGAVSEDSLLPVLAEQLQMEVLNAADLPEIDAGVVERLTQAGIPKDWWLDQEVVAWELSDGTVRVVAKDPLNNSVTELLERAFEAEKLQWCLLRSHDLAQLLEQLAHVDDQHAVTGGEVEHLRELAEEAPVIEFVNNLIAQAVEQKVSDIHLEPDEHQLQVRFRIDGVLYSRFTLPRSRFNAIASRVKLISGMDIAERRLPQDGKLRTRVSGMDLDIRVSTVPAVHGESIVMRLLPVQQKQIHLESLGMQSDHREIMQRWIHQPNGIVLVTGPTGSGKSTSLYAALEEINDGRKKIITVEDPVEYQIQGITQIQAHSDIGYTFARALRAILRQDPDVILIGEIRDLETAEIAVQSSLTGHLVLSTLHTNDSISAFSRLVDMGVEPFLVATPVRGVMAQRLVRCLCPNCAVEAEPLQEVQELVEGILPKDWQGGAAAWKQAGEGCSECQGTGYKGRLGIYELVEVTPELQGLIINGGSAAEMWQVARAGGSRSLREDGLLKARQGITSVEEVLRVTAE